MMTDKVLFTKTITPAGRELYSRAGTFVLKAAVMPEGYS